MIYKKLNEIVHFTLGKNPTRIKETEVQRYTPEDFENDLYCVNTVHSESSCIINLIISKASPTSVETMDKCLTSNFLKCEFDELVLDKWYLCFQFNEGRKVEQQIAMYHQGTTSSVKKLNIKTIGELKVQLPTIEKQREIGRIYKQSLIQNSLLLKQAEDIKTLTIELLRKMEEN